MTGVLSSHPVTDSITTATGNVTIYVVVVGNYDGGGGGGGGGGG